MKLSQQEVVVSAPRGLCFEVVAAAGTLVERRSDTQWVVEFVLPSSGRDVRTLELLTLERPGAIHYRWLEGPLDGVRETIYFEEIDPTTTTLRYVGAFAPRGGLLGWLLARFKVKPVFDRLVHEHLIEAKSVAERRAERSRIYPR